MADLERDQAEGKGHPAVRRRLGDIRAPKLLPRGFREYPQYLMNRIGQPSLNDLNYGRSDRRVPRRRVDNIPDEVVIKLAGKNPADRL